MQNFYKKNIQSLKSSHKRLQNPSTYKVKISKKLQELKKNLTLN
ncbi:hypothetical protein [Campylobacter volucris]